MTEQTLSSQYVYQGKAVALKVDEVSLPSGRKTIREVVEHKNCVVVIPLDKEGKVVFVQQYRYAVGKELIELPAGNIEPGESPQDCVQRELQEEIGYLAGKLVPLGGFYSTPGYSNEYLYAFLATELEPSSLTSEEERIKPIALSWEEINKLISDGKICDAKTLAALYLWQKQVVREIV